MTILYVFNDSSLGGATQSLLDTLKDIGKEVNIIVVMRQEVSFKSRFEALGVQCYEIPFSCDQIKIGTVTKEKTRADFKQSYEAAIRLLAIIKEKEVQLVHINSSISYFAAIAALMAKIPYVWHIREIMDEHYGCESLNSELKWYLYRQSDQLISISDYVRKYYQKYNMNTQRIYNGVVIERYKRAIETNGSFHNMFLMAAVIAPQKGQWDAIRAVELLINEGYEDIQLTIAGEGEERYVWALKKYIKNRKLNRNIIILPFQSDLSELRKKTSYALTCSQSEALGRMTIEAMLAGNLVIGARSGGTTEIIGGNEERGFLYKLHNFYDLAETMVRAIHCPKDMKYKMIKDAQTYVEKTFDSKRYCDRLLKIYNEVIVSYNNVGREAFLNQLNIQYNLIKNEKMFTQSEYDVRLFKEQTAFRLAAKWLCIRQKGYSLEEYFIKRDIHSIAIYGMAELGCRLYDELEEETIVVRYLIDKNPGAMKSVLGFTSLSGEMLNVDAIVVTVAAAEREIIEEIKNMGYEIVIGLSEILKEFEYKMK